VHDLISSLQTCHTRDQGRRGSKYFTLIGNPCHARNNYRNVRKGSRRHYTVLLHSPDRNLKTRSCHTGEPSSIAETE
jgi:hypothetical protein